MNSEYALVLLDSYSHMPKLVIPGFADDSELWAYYAEHHDGELAALADVEKRS